LQRVAHYLENDDTLLLTNGDRLSDVNMISAGFFVFNRRVHDYLSGPG